MVQDEQNVLSSLMNKAQNGDQEAYRNLLDRIGGLIISVIRQRINNEQTVEDIYQSVLLTIHRARHTYDSNRPFKPWLYSITRNAIIDYLRKNRKRIELETIIGENMEFKANQDTTEIENFILKKALEALPKNQREAVVLIKIEGLSLEEAANRAGITVGAMKVRAHRGYETLKKNLIHNAQEVY